MEQVVDGTAGLQEEGLAEVEFDLAAALEELRVRAVRMVQDEGEGL